MKSIALFITFVLFFSFSLTAQSIQHFAWLTGKWVNPHDHSSQRWAIANDTTINGVGYIMNDEDEPSLDEIMRLIARADGTYFVLVVQVKKKAQPVYYKIVSSSKKGFKAINDSRDFPKQVRFSLRGQKLLTVIFEGEHNGKKKRTQKQFVTTK